MTEEVNFEKSLKELEEIVRKMESGQVSLEDSLKNYEKGIALAKVCEDRLNKAKTTLEKLSVETDGSVKNH